jgi:REP element-mobilizing transposase RayT
MNEDCPIRKAPAHPPVCERLNCPTIVFVTVCTEKRKTILCRNDAHRLLLASWKKANSWLIGKYVLMPDHIHLFCAPSGGIVKALPAWIQYWKALVSRSWPHIEEQPIWQKSFWDTQMRRGEGYEAKWEYVRWNPIRKGLARSPEEWPYQGCLNELAWQE